MRQKLLNLIQCGGRRSGQHSLVRVIACVAFVGCMIVLAAYLDVRPAQAQAAPLACPAGTEQNGALCYPLCQDGFYGDGPTCWQRCPTGYTDDGAFCRKGAHIFAKHSYGRGAGVGLVCASNQQAQGGLCYPRCAAGYYGVGPVCWQYCRPGYADHGATCFRHIFDFYGKPTYGRGGGVPVSVCASGLQRSGALCYPRCAAGFYGDGPVCWQQCPAGYTNDGAVCRKDAIIFAKANYGRGAGVVMNSVPVAIDETVRTPKDTAVELRFPADSFDDDELSPVVFVQDPSHGDVDAGIYTPNPGFEGVDSILWKTNDGKHDSNVAIATVLVGDVGVNAAPVALDRTVEVREDAPILVTVTCTDADNDDLLYQLLEKPQHGEYQWLAPNTVIYTPTADFVGIDSFTFRSYDGQEASNVSTITLTVAAVNDAPLAIAQQISTTRNVNAGIQLLATDVEGDPITYTVVTSPTHGLLSGAAPDLAYTPENNFIGADSFQFQASDAQGAATVATIEIAVQPSNTAPVAANGIVTTSVESAVAINLAASDADEDPLTYTLVTSPTHGALTGIDADWVYTPHAGFTGVDGFVFKANDGQADSPAATVTVAVLPAPATAALVGIVFEDSNGNGQADAEDSGVSGLLVTVTAANRQIGDAAATFTTQTDRSGAWRLEDVPVGQYTVRIAAAPGIELAEALETQITVAERGLLQLAPAAVIVTSRSTFLPVVAR